MQKHADTLSRDAVEAFARPLQGETALVTPWLFSPQSSSSDTELGELHGKALTPLILRASNVDVPAALFESLKRLVLTAAGEDREVGLISKVVVQTPIGPKFMHVDMCDIAPGVRIQQLFKSVKNNEVVLNSGNSFHVYGERLLDDMGVAERLKFKYPIDTAWTGFCMIRGFAVLRVTGATKPSPFRVSGPLS